MLTTNELIEKSGKSPFFIEGYSAQKDKYYNVNLKFLRNGHFTINRYYRHIGVVDHDNLNTNLKHQSLILKESLYKSKLNSCLFIFEDYFSKCLEYGLFSLKFKLSRYKSYLKRRDSLNRTRRNLIDIIMNNYDIWKSFITLTFDPSLVGQDLTREDALRKYFGNYLRQVKRAYPDFTAIRVDEFQKNGRTHFHLVTNVPVGHELIPKKEQKRLYNSKSRKMVVLDYYDLKYWNYGFSSAFDITSNNDNLDDNFNIALYVSKYLTKDIDVRYFGKRKFGVINRKNLHKVQEYKFSELNQEKKAILEFIETNIACERYSYFPDDDNLYALPKDIITGIVKPNTKIYKILEDQVSTLL